MSLTNTKINTAKPADKLYKLSDEKGLYLQVNPNGSKYWRLKYRFGGKEKKLAIGIYPEISLTEAREKRDAARKLLANDIDPGLNKQITKNVAKQAEENSFQTIALEWFSKFSVKWASSHSSKILGRLEKNVFPWLGKRPIHEIKSDHQMPLV